MNSPGYNGRLLLRKDKENSIDGQGSSDVRSDDRENDKGGDDSVVEESKVGPMVVKPM